MEHQDCKDVEYEDYLFRFYFHNKFIEILKITKNRYEQLKIIDIKEQELIGLEKIVQKGGEERSALLKEMIKEYDL